MKNYYEIKYYETGCGYIPEYSHSEYVQAESEQEVVNWVKKTKVDGYKNSYETPDNNQAHYGYDLISKAGAVAVTQIEILQI